jgi:alkanesulfonate monooxygenase SsuD/methylene tetrahydromethanopterin reductase-like flavin-dependent oxidoreductase (luciferase family)
MLIEPDSLTRIITEGEALGFDYVTISDHIMVPRNLESKYPYTNSGEFPAGTQAAWLEQLATTAYIAALTKKLRFVLSVMVVPHRPAVLTAKLLSTIDFLSKGRLTLGIGVGWCRKEFEAIGAAPFDDRGLVTDEWMDACRELWTSEFPKFSGKYVNFDDSRLRQSRYRTRSRSGSAVRAGRRCAARSNTPTAGIRWAPTRNSR